jgi:chromosome segregation ATPase
VTTRRELPLTNDTLAWVHGELAEIKSRLSLVQQAAEQSRAVPTDAADTAHVTHAALNQFDGVAPAIMHLQDDLHSLRDVLARIQNELHSLRQSRDEFERRIVIDEDRVRQDQNDAAHRFAELERHIESWRERFSGFEEHYRRNLEMASQLAMRIEAIENQIADTDTSQARTMSTLSRLDQELQSFSGAVLALRSEDSAHRERVNSTIEALRRLEAETEAVRIETNKISRLDDRLELVQAERTRHNERLNEITTELTKIDSRLNQDEERTAVIESRISGYQEDLRKLRERLQMEREQLGIYLNSIRDLEADLRKRQIAALEKDIRDIRGRAFDVASE